MADELGQQIDSKFQEAVDTDMSGGDDEGMDEFFEETFEGMEQEGSGDVADFDEDLGYGADEPEGGEGEEPGEDGAGKESGEEEETPDEDIEDEDIDESPDEEVEDTDVSDEKEGEDEGEGEEDEVFYDGERDFGDDAVPTQYNDRMSLNHGLVAKVSYFNDLNERLQEAGTDIGAISLPEAINGDPQNLNQFADVEQVMSMPDEQAKKMVAEMDKTLRNMKNKAQRYEELQEKKQEKEQLTEEYIQAQQEAQTALDVLGLEVEKGMTNDEVINKAYDKLEEFESDEGKLDELSQKEFVSKLREMEDAVFALEDFARVAVEHEQAKQEDSQEDQKVTPEQIESSFKEFMQDQPDLDMVKNNRVEMQKSLIQTAIRKGWNLATPRDWLNNYRKFMKIVNANRTKKGLKNLKDGTKDGDGKDKKKGDDNNNNGRAKKYANKKPAKSRSGSLSYSNRTDKKEIDEIDNEIDRIASQLTDERSVSDNW